jgi:hypothetical protein
MMCFVPTCAVPLTFAALQRLDFDDLDALMDSYADLFYQVG